SSTDTDIHLHGNSFQGVEWRDDQGAEIPVQALTNNRFSYSSDYAMYRKVRVSDFYASAYPSIVTFQYHCLEDPLTMPDFDMDYVPVMYAQEHMDVVTHAAHTGVS